MRRQRNWEIAYINNSFKKVFFKREQGNSWEGKCSKIFLSNGRNKSMHDSIENEKLVTQDRIARAMF